MHERMWVLDVGPVLVRPSEVVRYQLRPHIECRFRLKQLVSDDAVSDGIFVEFLVGEDVQFKSLSMRGASITFEGVELVTPLWFTLNITSKKRTQQVWRASLLGTAVTEGAELVEKFTVDEISRISRSKKKRGR